MGEREAVSVVPAQSTFNWADMRKGDITDKVLLVTYSDGSVAYRCSVCEKEFGSFSSTWGHFTHHSRTKASYIHDGRSISKKKKDPTEAVRSIVKRMLIEAIDDIADDISSSLTVSNRTAEIRMEGVINDLRVKLAEEHALRVKAEKDLAKIKNLFK